MFEHLLDALLHGSGYERIATTACSDRTIRRRLEEWSEAAVAQRIHAISLAAYDRIIGLELDDLSVDGCITKVVCGGDKAGPSPVDRRKGGLKRSIACDGYDIPLGIVSVGANRHDSPLLAPTFEAAKAQVGPLPEHVTSHLDAAYDSGVTHSLLLELGFEGISRTGVPAPIQVGNRWVIERTHSWMNGYGKLRRCTDKKGPRRLLPLPRRRPRDRPSTDPTSPHPLPLGHPTHRPTPKIARSRSRRLPRYAPGTSRSS